jgi:AcrR family transcriptional regulator
MRPRSAETRVRIIEAALRAFGDAGFDGALTRTIAHNAGVQQPLINYHFGSKDGLWRASVDHLFGQLEARVAEAMPRLASLDPVVRGATITLGPAALRIIPECTPLMTSGSDGARQPKES